MWEIGSAFNSLFPSYLFPYVYNAKALKNFFQGMKQLDESDGFSLNYSETEDVLAKS